MKTNSITQNITQNYSQTTEKKIKPEISSNISIGQINVQKEPDLAEILLISSYPPRECGLATYSQDLIKALNNKFSDSFTMKVCALESGKSDFSYPEEVKYTLNTSSEEGYNELFLKINNDKQIKIVLIQHEFGLYKEQEEAFYQFLYEITKPIIIVFHSVIPRPDNHLISNVQYIASLCKSVVVMTNNSADILMKDYEIPKNKISVISHGTHLVRHLSKSFLKIKYGLKGKKVLSTFGLLSSGKSIETTIEALPEIVKQFPETVFLIIGKTHPEVVKTDGEKYRNYLQQKVAEYKLQDHVIFINQYLALPDLLEYLQLSDIYLFTSSDPNQAVSGTFAYAMSCACPIISTPIPHAKEILTGDTGIIIDFCSSQQLTDGVIRLLSNNTLRRNMSSNALQKIVSSAWENSAVDHMLLMKKIAGDQISIKYNLPSLNFNHLKKMTTNMGIIQFSKTNQPDLSSGYTLDDNARALITSCMNYKLTGDSTSLNYIKIYLGFIKLCQQPEGNFLNYVNKDLEFTDQNSVANLDDANGRAVWALGYLMSFEGKLSEEITDEARVVIDKAIPGLETIHSTRAMAFAIKGLYNYYNTTNLPQNLSMIKTLANRLVQMYKHESNPAWEWFEGYLTYANSILPEAMLYAWLLTGKSIYKDIAKSSLKFLLSQTFNENGIEVISNKNWLQKGQLAEHFGEQPIDVAYTIMTLSKFYDSFMDREYYLKMQTAFNWFLGKNRLHQIIYNPCSGGCYDGLEESHVNLNQGAESTVSYMMARLTIEKYRHLNYQYTLQDRCLIKINLNPTDQICSARNSVYPDHSNLIPLSLISMEKQNLNITDKV